MCCSTRQFKRAMSKYTELFQQNAESSTCLNLEIITPPNIFSRVRLVWKLQLAKEDRSFFLRKLRGTVSSVGSREYSTHNTKTEDKHKCNELTKANNQTKNLTFLKCSSLSISDLQSISGNTSSMRKEAGDLGLGKNETTINETESYEAQVICSRPYKVAKLDCLMNNHSSN